MFGINHCAGSSAYNACNSVDRDADVLDRALISLLRASGELFIAKLFCDPVPDDRHAGAVISRPTRAPWPFEDADGDESGYRAGPE